MSTTKQFDIRGTIDENVNLEVLRGKQFVCLIHGFGRENETEIMKGREYVHKKALYIFCYSGERNMSLDSKKIFSRMKLTLPRT